MTPPSNAQVIERASQLGGPVPVLEDGDVFHLPVLTTEFVSERFPSLNGTVRLRFPAFGDELEIDRLAAIMGGTLLSRVNASFRTCLIGAPLKWFRPSSTSDVTPVLALERIPDSPALVALFGKWLEWRDSFRESVPASTAPESAVKSPEAPLAVGSSS
jgi:hypothetical protein